MSGPGQTVGFSVFVDPITEALDISRGQLTTGYLAATLLAAPSGLWLGRQLDNRKIATIIRSVGIGLALALCVAAASPALWMLIIGIFGLRLFGQTGFTLTSSVFVARSITERRGAALGLLAATGGAALSLTPLIASRIIPHLGYRQTWLLLAAVVLAAANALAWSAARTPAEIGRGDRLNTITVAVPALDITTEPAPTVDADLARRRRNAFLVVAAGYSTVSFTSTALGFHQIAILEERGLTAAAAAANFLPQSIAAAVVALSIGRIIDRVNGRFVIPLCMVALATAVLSVRIVGASGTAVVYGVALGAAASSVAASEGALLTRWLGTEGLGKVRGRLMASAVAASAIAPLALTLLADATGSYTNAATTAAALPMAVAVIASLAPLPTHAAA